MPNPTPDFNSFDPNGSQATVWGVWDGYSFVVKGKRGGLITRFSNAVRAKLYELTPQGWEVRAVKDSDAHDDNCDLCKQPNLRANWDAWETAQPNYRWRPHGVDRGWCWRRNGRKLADPLEHMLVCPDCKEATGWY